MEAVLPLILFALCAAGLSVVMRILPRLLAPGRENPVKEIPYESGMDPIHDARRRFDVRFHLVAIAFLVFDVELLFLYPWAVDARNPAGIDAALLQGLVSSREPGFGEGMLFLA